MSFPVTVTVARRVTPGHEAEFERWAAGLTAEAARFAGFLGAGLLSPGRPGGAWHVVYRFDTAAHLTAWEESAVRAHLLAAGEAIMETTAVPGRAAAGAVRAAGRGRHDVADHAAAGPRAGRLAVRPAGLSRSPEHTADVQLTLMVALTG
jgi:heme-degrading monooxygenase HmoA